jgi:hypothetical protein
MFKKLQISFQRALGIYKPKYDSIDIVKYKYKIDEEPSTTVIINSFRLLEIYTDEVKINTLLNLAHTCFLADSDDIRIVIKHFNTIIQLLNSNNERIVKNALKLICENSASSNEFHSFIADTELIEYILQLLTKTKKPKIIAWVCYTLCVLL